MIITIMFLVIILLGIMSIKLGENNYSDFGDLLEIFGVASTVIGSVCLIVSILAIIGAHVAAPKIIQENKLNYEGLCKRAAIIKSEAERERKMQIVIDIPEYIYKLCQGHGDIVYNCVGKGKPLPKGHGRILDEKDILNTENNDGGWYDLVDMPEYIAGVKAIIEADKEEE